MVEAEVYMRRFSRYVSLNTTPIGQVLKKIAILPEVRAQKVLNVRQQLTEGEYDLNERLDVALDKVLEDLITQ